MPSLELRVSEPSLPSEGPIHISPVHGSQLLGLLASQGGGTLPPWVPLLFTDALPKGKGPTPYLPGYQEDGKEGR